jgi:hypothetical protein
MLAAASSHRPRCVESFHLTVLMACECVGFCRKLSIHLSVFLWACSLLSLKQLLLDARFCNIRARVLLLSSSITHYFAAAATRRLHRVAVCGRRKPPITQLHDAGDLLLRCAGQLYCTLEQSLDNRRIAVECQYMGCITTRSQCTSSIAYTTGSAVYYS